MIGFGVSGMDRAGIGCTCMSVDGSPAAKGLGDGYIGRPACGEVGLKGKGLVKSRGGGFEDVGDLGSVWGGGLSVGGIIWGGKAGVKGVSRTRYGGGVCSGGL